MRSVCANALNSGQLAASLRRGVHQIELSPDLCPTSPGSGRSSLGSPHADEEAGHGQWGTWGAGVRNAVTGVRVGCLLLSAWQVKSVAVMQGSHNASEPAGAVASGTATRDPQEKNPDNEPGWKP